MPLDRRAIDKAWGISSKKPALLNDLKPNAPDLPRSSSPWKAKNKRLLASVIASTVEGPLVIALRDKTARASVFELQEGSKYSSNATTFETNLAEDADHWTAAESILLERVQQRADQETACLKGLFGRFDFVVAFDYDE